MGAEAIVKVSCSTAARVTEPNGDRLYRTGLMSSQFKGCEQAQRLRRMQPSLPKFEGCTKGAFRGPVYPNMHCGLTWPLWQHLVWGGDS